MSTANSFAGFNPKPSPWGYNWTSELPPPKEAPTKPSAPQQQASSPEPQMLANQYEHMPAALLNTMKRDKKPFTYTPGGVNLSEVLNARLQKRMDRKKKYSEERSHQNQDLPKFESPKQVIVMPTYNTPLDMYSMENALEILEAQAELVANDKSLSSTSRSATLPRNHTFKFEENDIDPGRGVTQSRAFKVLQIITDTDEEPTSASKNHHREEVRFTGIRDSKAIPSRFFQTLQKITGTEEDEEEEQQMQHRPFAQHQRSQPQQQYQQQQYVQPQQQQYVQQQQQQQQQSFNQPMMCNNTAVYPSQDFSTTSLKRPAAFLPIKTSSAPGGFRPVSFLANGSSGRRVVHPSGGTNF